MIAPDIIALTERLHARGLHITIETAGTVFAPVSCDGPFAKGLLDPTFVAEQEERVTRAWRRLQELPALGLPLLEYPLAEVRQAWQQARSP